MNGDAAGAWRRGISIELATLARARESDNNQRHLDGQLDGQLDKLGDSEIHQIGNIPCTT